MICTKESACYTSTFSLSVSAANFRWCSENFTPEGLKNTTQQPSLNTWIEGFRVKLIVKPFSLYTNVERPSPTPLSSMHGTRLWAGRQSRYACLKILTVCLQVFRWGKLVGQYFCNFLERVKEFSCQSDECEIYLHFACVLTVSHSMYALRR